MLTQSVALVVPTSAGEGAPSIDLSQYSGVTIQVAGVTASSLNLEASVDGTNFVAIKTGLANGISTLDTLLASARATVKFLRVHTISIGGGETPTVRVLAQSLGY